MQSEDKDKKKDGETSKKKEIKKFKELSFDAAGSEGSHDSGAALHEDEIIRPDSPSKPSQVRSLIDDRDSPHLRRFIQSARHGSVRKAGLAPPRPERQTNSDQPEQIEEKKDVMSASCDVLLPETNTDTSSAASPSSKPTAIVKPCHKQEPGDEVEPVIEKKIEEPEEQLKPEKEQEVNINDSEVVSKTAVITEIDSVSAKNELDSEHAAVKSDAVIDQSTAEDDNGHEGDANTAVIAQAEKVVEVTQESLDELSAKIMRCDEDIRTHRAEIKRVDTNNEQMLIVVDEFERTIQQIVKERERESVYLEIQREAAARERNEVVADLQNVERAFNDLSSKFERTKDVVASFAATEEGLKQNVDVLASR